MSDQIMMEEPLQFGQGGRLFGILTQPSPSAHIVQALPIFVFLSSGITHRAGPRRLYVRLARKLAEIGFTSLRVDLAGKGDSFSRQHLTAEQSLMEDFSDIITVLEARQNQLQLIACGLCSGADDAIRVTSEDPRVVGMVLLDPVCEQDEGFQVRDMVKKFTHLGRYQRKLKHIARKVFNPDNGNEPSLAEVGLRDSPSSQQTQAAFELIRQRKGRVFSLLTSYSQDYYNQLGQMGRVLGLDNYQDYCTEHYWPGASHTYSLEHHRAKLIEEIKVWAAGFIHS
ncbi:hypothetical protein MNBD_GAMMA07-82 [hydrothermal vent metagenome]|uniref:Serine aminopeptidase S33 domain-containing protein n=1 Tax=hydrothermal vent metagenome TaxID=652676 RepID=A0A3B0WVI1_9ZZZZ